MRIVLGILLLGLTLVGASAAESDSAAEASGSEESDTPEWNETQEVSVVLGERPSGPLGGSSRVIDPDDGAGMPSALTGIVSEVPGVSQNGQAGLFQVFSMRGVSRQRVGSFVSGMRITSERRAGVSASFLDPTLMGSVEILSGPATTFHGSGAMGGVIDVAPREFSGWSFGLGYDSVGNENYQVLGVGGERWSFGFARRDAGDARAADGTTLNSHFTQYSAVFQTDWGRGNLRYELVLIPTLGEDIGKANTDFPERTTNYPQERHGLVRFSVSSERGWRLDSFIHPHDLETEVVEQGFSQSNVFNDSFDFGVGWKDRRQVGSGLVVLYGVDGFGRRDVDAEEVVQFVTTPQPQTFQTLDGAEETELGAYGSVRRDRGRTRWEVGTRLSWQSQSNAGEPSVDRNAWNGFAGVSHRFAGGFELLANLSTGERFPTLTELFFTGTTGRGRVIGNPRLDSERSLNGEVSLRWAGRTIVQGATLFRNRIDGYIERIEIAPDVLSFVNITSGTISGLELQGLWRPGHRWNMSWGGHLIDGEDSAGGPLADTPPHELYTAGGYRLGRWLLDARLTLRAARDDPAGGEKPIPSAQLLGASVRYQWTGGWEIALSGTNLLDEAYYASADRKAPLAPGRSFALQLIRRGGG